MYSLFMLWTIVIRLITPNIRPWMLGVMDIFDPGFLLGLHIQPPSAPDILQTSSVSALVPSQYLMTLMGSPLPPFFPHSASSSSTTWHLHYILNMNLYLHCYSLWYLYFCWSVSSYSAFSIVAIVRSFLHTPTVYSHLLYFWVPLTNFVVICWTSIKLYFGILSTHLNVVALPLI